MPVGAVLFDMDGTVTEFTFDVAGAREAVAGILIQSGVPDEMISREIQVYQMLNLGSRYLEDNGADPSTVLDRAYDELERVDLRSATDPKLTPGIDELLDFLRQRSVPTVLVTNSSERAARSVLTRLNLQNLFTRVVARRKGLRLKPHPDMILCGLSAISVKPSPSVYVVGDSWLDMRAAVLAGVTGIGFSRDESSLRSLLSAGAAIAFISMKDVQAFLSSAMV
jgi:beta-phosphoglucomutase-like phosphatase (HAD superfamily)